MILYFNPYKEMKNNKTLLICPKVIADFIASVLTGKSGQIFIEPPSEYFSAYFSFFSLLFFFVKTV